jgi:hypothetical protein
MMLFDISKQPVFLQQDTLTDAARGQDAGSPIFGQLPIYNRITANLSNQHHRRGAD